MQPEMQKSILQMARGAIMERAARLRQAVKAELEQMMA